jgi:hypothetical protein
MSDDSTDARRPKPRGAKTRRFPCRRLLDYFHRLLDRQRAAREGNRGKAKPVDAHRHSGTAPCNAGFLFHAKVSPIFVTLFALEKAVDWLEEVSDEQYQA